MRKLGGSFFEQHIEKIVFAVALVLCGWIGWTQIFFCPNTITVDDRQFKPGQVDIYISDKARAVQARLNSKAVVKKTYESKAQDFLALMKSPLAQIDTNITLLQPVSTQNSIHPKYRMPQIGEVAGVDAEHIRAAAYIPIHQINLENVDDQAAYAPNDLDLVTVEGKFDVSSLYESFHESFAGTEVPEQWRAPRLAKPVFAAVQLQRQGLLDDVGWSKWEDVPRVRIDARRDMFSIVEQVVELSAGGVKVKRLKFDDPVVQSDLLQPAAYRIASSDEEWFPPAIHKKYVANQSQIDLQKKREAREEAAAKKKEEREQAREKAKQERRTTRPATATSPGSGGGPQNEQAFMQLMYGGSPMGTSTSRRTRTTVKKPRAGSETAADKSKKLQRTMFNVNEFYSELKDISLTGKNLAKMAEPLVFWAYDDTVQAGQTYRYRIRLGVFNPVAGTEEFAQSDLSYKDKVILWSGFSDVTEPVSIPAMLYFFPVNMQEASKAVEVQVSKYALGYWYNEQFMVKRGETIGTVADTKVEQSSQDLMLPERIDYDTGAILVDVVPVNDLSGRSLHSRRYFDMLYSYDGKVIERVPVKLVNWPNELRLKFGKVRLLAKKTKEPLRAWGGKGVRRISPIPTMPGMMPPGAGGQMTPDQLFMQLLMERGGPPQ